MTKNHKARSASALKPAAVKPTKRSSDREREKLGAAVAMPFTNAIREMIGIMKDIARITETTYRMVETRLPAPVPPPAPQKCRLEWSGATDDKLTPDLERVENFILGGFSNYSVRDVQIISRILQVIDCDHGDTTPAELFITNLLRFDYPGLTPQAVLNRWHYFNQFFEDMVADAHSIVEKYPKPSAGETNAPTVI